jgi:hypothetical protein
MDKHLKDFAADSTAMSWPIFTRLQLLVHSIVFMAVLARQGFFDLHPHALQ